MFKLNPVGLILRFLPGIETSYWLVNRDVSKSRSVWPTVPLGSKSTSESAIKVCRSKLSPFNDIIFWRRHNYSNDLHYRNVYYSMILLYLFCIASSSSFSHLDSFKNAVTLLVSSVRKVFSTRFRRIITIIHMENRRNNFDENIFDDKNNSAKVCHFVFILYCSGPILLFNLRPAQVFKRFCLSFLSKWMSFLGFGSRVVLIYLRKMVIRRVENLRNAYCYGDLCDVRKTNRFDSILYFIKPFYLKILLTIWYDE